MKLHVSSVAIALVITVSASLAFAEGTAELGTAQSLQSSTDLRVDIVDPDVEALLWTGAGDVEVFAPDDSRVGEFASGETIDLSAHPTGTYRIVLATNQPNGAAWDVTVVGQTSPGGRLFSRDWDFDAGSFEESAATNASFYARLDAGREDVSAVVELRLAGLAGYGYQIAANTTGVDGPDAGRSVPAAGNSISNPLPLYLNPPTDADYAVVSPSVSEFEFASSVSDSCNVVVPGVTTGTFYFDTDVYGTFQLICDLNGDGVFDGASTNDLLLTGSTEPGTTGVVWDGTDDRGLPVPSDDYECVARVAVGEFHYLALDIETSYPGLRMYQVFDDGTRRPLPMFWDDALVQAAAVPMPNDEIGASTSGADGVDSGLYDDTPVPHSTTVDGNARSWGRFQSGSKGNDNILDTYVFLEATISTTVSVVAASADLDTDGDGATDVDEICSFGTDPTDEDSDDGGRTDGEETGIDGTDPSLPTDDVGFDFDDDGLVNEREAALGLNPADPDGDRDGRLDGEEVDGDPTSDPFDPDTDDGGVSDGDEVNRDGTDPNVESDDVGFDFDGDGLLNEREALLGTNPELFDTDGDGRSDGEEVDGDPVTDPLNDDSDDGGVSDGGEIEDGTDPTDPGDDIGFDFDEDGLTNEREAALGLNPIDPDSDDDGRLDGEEVDGDPVSDPFDPDSDDGGVNDGDEVIRDGTDPNDERDDVGFDLDGDGLTNEREAEIGTDPTLFDTDGDGRGDGDEVDGEPPTDPFVEDTDSGGVNDGGEIEDGTDPTDPGDDIGFDFDGDGLVNEREVALGLDPANPDTDGDGRSDGQEVDGDPTSDPFDPDSDDGGVNDGDEVLRDGTDPNAPEDDIGFDLDEDGLANEREALLGTDPALPDTDGDGRTDAEEVDGEPQTDPLVEDSDNGGVSDGGEILDGTDPNNPEDDTGFDFDDDGLENEREAALALDPADPDTDDDGRLDGDEVDGEPASDPFDPDSDDGGVFDGQESNVDGTDPTDPSDDIGEDFDDDGVNNEDEAAIGADPRNPDTDGDGIEDGGERGRGTDPANPDTDRDGLGDGDEVQRGTDPTLADTDADGVDDGDEVEVGTDPLNPPIDAELEIAGGGGLKCAASGSTLVLWWALPVLLMRRRRVRS